VETISSVDVMKRWSRRHRAEGKTIGFVPTMGFLHEGHISLMSRGRAENDLLVASIFVNPTQFGPNEDLSSYPRDPEADAVKCANAGVDALFMPEPADMYGTDFQTYVDVQKVSAPLCGSSRPGHFRGVATVVLKLMNMVIPNTMYFGEKDFQQLRVIKTMVRDLDMDVTIVSCPTVRERDGLAMSSRNAYLSASQRVQAICLYQALLLAKERFLSGDTRAKNYLEAMSGRIHQEPEAVPDYISLVDPDTLQHLDEVKNSALAVLAVRVGKTRLIDNMLFQRADSERDAG
jgi:pantoate--beta-alanine ligase